MSVSSSSQRVLLDARSAAGSRLTGWERYTRTLSSIAVEWPEVSIRSTRSEALIQRLRDDWVSVPFAAKDYGTVHYPSFPPAYVPKGVRGIATIYDLTWWKYPETSSLLGRHYYKRLAERAADYCTLVTISETVRSELEEQFPNSSVSVVSPVPGLLNVEADNRARRARPYILAIGSIEPRKNLGRLAKAFERASISREIDLVVVGRNAWGELPTGVIGVGAVSDAYLRGLLEGAIALFCPSIYEGFGLPGVEASSMGVPVHCSSIDVFKETVPEARDFFDPLDVESIAASIELAVERTDRPDPSVRYSRRLTTEQLSVLYGRVVS